ncbi:MAG: ligase-associated DNA damage response endonuclease PdeM [Rhodospirillum sp.]|nr:ligase-associated DNA damage response endonuclease PdeM [Rhodospirillum sp.]MCF8490196.1 ligase-associated DNA damage response endonuclease PdeM [Rhodospirillum sp.]MCF8500346.1 ligase-associated DNA damage response endonuclease PdeM [Rhodospirillum sp.]
MMVNGARLLPDPSGALYWPGERALIVADMHLEKGSAMAGRTGQLVPPLDSRATLAKLKPLVRRHDPKVVICLGDAFHDGAAAARLGGEETSLLRSLTQGRDWVWITGNHDPVPPEHLGGRGMAELTLGPLTFRHQAVRGGGLRVGRGEISGHYHPKASLTVNGQRLVRPCFITDQSRLILPAFGAYTGGLDVWEPAIQGLFHRDFRVFLVGESKVHSFNSGRLDKPGGAPRPGGGVDVPSAQGRLSLESPDTPPLPVRRGR